MRILVHDYSGHPFQVQLSRALARRGHHVLHVHCASYSSGKGDLVRHPGDAPTFEVDGIDLGRAFDRYSPVRRLRQELSYGRAFVTRAREFGPEVVLSSNDPLFAKAVAGRWCRRSATPWVFWLQDVYSVAMGNHARAKVKVAGPALARGFEAVERRLARQAGAVVAITDDFRPVLERWGVDGEVIEVIENWAPLGEIGRHRRDNAWAAEHHLGADPVLLYAGTLGLKHDPRGLLALARRFSGADGHEPRATVVVVSEGAGARWLREQGGDEANLVVVGYQPFERLGEVLASADVLVALLDPAAGEFSVPSKILSYLCAGRAILAAVPQANLAARTIAKAGAGVVVDPAEPDALVAGAEDLLADAQRRLEHGRSARRYAEESFDIEAIADRFEAVLVRAAGRVGAAR